MASLASFRGFFAGSGAAFFSSKEGCDRLLALTGRYTPGQASVSQPVNIAYVGTATYDMDRPAHQVLDHFITRGCVVASIGVANPGLDALSKAEDEFLRKEADIVLVSGGNTLYAIRRWEETGLTRVLKDVLGDPSRMCIAAGGSAGAICWFTSGHSDSADPSTYLKPTLMRATGRESEIDPDSLSTKWQYIRVHGMDMLPGMLCPHFDTVGSNSVEREDDFRKMLRRHPTERGIAIDHWAALILPGDGTYEVFSVPGAKRENADSLLDVGVLPGVYVVEVDPETGKVKPRAVPRTGRVEDLLRAPTGPVVRDPFESFFAMENSTPSSGSFPTR